MTKASFSSDGIRINLFMRSHVFWFVASIFQWRIAMEKTSSMARSLWLITWFHYDISWHRRVQSHLALGQQIVVLGTVGRLRRWMCMQFSGLSEVQRWVFLTPSTIGLGLNWPVYEYDIYIYCVEPRMYVYKYIYIRSISYLSLYTGMYIYNINIY